MTALGYRVRRRRAATGAPSSPRGWATRIPTASGIHLNLLPSGATRTCLQTRRRGEAFLDELAAWIKEEIGYQWIQGTRPQTLAFALTDLPAGLAAWIVEKFRAWSDAAATSKTVFTKDQLLANISFTGSPARSARLSGPTMRACTALADAEGKTVDVPTGYSEFPREILRPPRRSRRDLPRHPRWTVMERGGHFAAMEQPDALAAEIRAFFRPLRRPRAFLNAQPSARHL